MASEYIIAENGTNAADGSSNNSRNREFYSDGAVKLTDYLACNLLLHHKTVVTEVVPRHIFSNKMLKVNMCFVLFCTEL